MSILEGILYLNFAMGLLACLYYARQKGEILISDLIFIVIITIFGCITLWSYLYDEYVVQIHNFIDKMSKVGKKPLWRSKSTIAKEILFGDNKNDDT